MIQLTTPVSEADVRSLKVGDEVAITGTVFTGRDAVHKYLHEGGLLPPGVSFPAVVTIDAHGNSLHKEVLAVSQAELAKYL